MFPAERPRRLRRTPALRRLVAETTLTPANFVAPLFVAEGLREPRPIPTLPGHVQHTIESLRDEVAALARVGVTSVILFGVPEQKDEIGSGAWDPNGVAQVALRALRDDFGDDVVVMADLCLDEYTSHGHCGVVRRDGTVDNDATLELYARTAIAQAEAGAQVVAPSGMMDGQVGAIRAALDEASRDDVTILAYAAKYASVFYGPFRDAVGVEIVGGGDRKSYQQDFANRREALREARADVEQGADLVMVKPAMSYLDVVADLRRELTVPLCAYHVSGEYAMIKAAAAQGWLDASAAAVEQLTAVRRAGADFVLTYFARELAEEWSR
ncbi:MAG: porphobilinogen synthase [Acidobacteriota bacterium]|nr:porphobilinogen synthase [Acidobacteriota bacterium]MDE3043212.1 porphobilinogen synthase [Acidobacteriota bacterium]MDE3106534.1 porphobilinogen synthase [Acidobacteriota bacterium]MDE3222622.1 porphobilinogen synthase [Acidobacteriota bacterium]